MQFMFGMCLRQQQKLYSFLLQFCTREWFLFFPSSLVSYKYAYDCVFDTRNNDNERKTKRNTKVLKPKRLIDAALRQEIQNEIENSKFRSDDVSLEFHFLHLRLSSFFWLICCVIRNVFVSFSIDEEKSDDGRCVDDGRGW